MDEKNEDALVRKISTEAHGIPLNNTKYDLNDFSHAKTKQQTTATLRRFLSKIIANGEVTKASLSLSQSIQYSITDLRNQTTLRMGLKLHHKFGCSDLIHISHEHGYTVSYEEVLQFRMPGMLLLNI